MWAVHRVESPGKTPMVLMEVEIGNYLGEGHIVHYAVVTLGRE
ncbi:MAG: mannose-6-phosphate isomerase-like protein (cupin superfamily) [Paracoccaceae bacterium]|jgi:mannose-6-phosphate isomerase-like protein (cupin superfamily)